MKEILRLCLVLTTLTAVSAGVLAFISQQTAEPIALAKLEEKLTAVRNVLPRFDNDPDKDKVYIARSPGDTVEVYRGRKENEIVGVAFVMVSPDGYSGDIEFMIGVNRDGVVQGLEILKHLETPGLGAKIETAEFSEQFRGKSLDNPENWAVTKDGGTFVPITGATISSRAITGTTARGLEFFRQHRSEIMGEEKNEGEGE